MSVSNPSKNEHFHNGVLWNENRPKGIGGKGQNIEKGRRKALARFFLVSSLFPFPKKNPSLKSKGEKNRHF